MEWRTVAPLEETGVDHVEETGLSLKWRRSKAPSQVAGEGVDATLDDLWLTAVLVWMAAGWGEWACVREALVPVRWGLLGGGRRRARASRGIGGWCRMTAQPLGRRCRRGYWRPPKTSEDRRRRAMAEVMGKVGRDTFIQG
ncbi:hypothetical protein GCM10023319_49700 [Nocardia iowensis]